MQNIEKMELTDLEPMAELEPLPDFEPLPDLSAQVAAVAAEPEEVLFGGAAGPGPYDVNGDLTPGIRGRPGDEPEALAEPVWTSHTIIEDAEVVFAETCSFGEPVPNPLAGFEPAVLLPNIVIKPWFRIGSIAIGRIMP